MNIKKSCSNCAHHTVSEYEDGCECNHPKGNKFYTKSYWVVELLTGKSGCEYFEEELE